MNGKTHINQREFMSFFPPMLLLKRSSIVDPHKNTDFNLARFYLAYAGAYTVVGAFAPGYFKGNPASLAVQFAVTGLFSALISLAINHKARQSSWTKEKLRAALSTVDLICDATLLVVIVKVAKVNDKGKALAGSLVGMGLCLTLLDGYRALRVRQRMNPNYRQHNERDVENAIVNSEAHLEGGPSGVNASAPPPPINPGISV